MNATLFVRPAAVGLISSLASLVSLASLACETSRAQSCPIRSFGPTCGVNAAGTHEVARSGRRIFLTFQGNPSVSAGLMVLGASPASIPVTGGCTILTVPQIVLPVSFAAGTGRFVLVNLPRNLQLGTTYAQVGVLRTTPSGPRIDTSNALILGPWQGIQSFADDFKTRDRLDMQQTTLLQLDSGRLVINSFGIDNDLGDFDPSIGGKAAGKDSAGRQIYEWNTDLVVIPASRTRSGKEVRVTDGVLRFRNFRLAKDVRLRFFGKHPVRISATRDIVVDGVIDASGEGGERLQGAGGRPGTVGQAARRGGPGGGAGGRGGDVPRRANAVVNGQSGGSPTIAGHPYATALAERGGVGSKAFPQPPVDLSVRFSAFSNVICQTATSGGSGANFLTRGGTGRTARNQIGRETPQPFDFGGPTAPRPGMIPAYYVKPASASSFDFFLIPGAGGGGAGTHPSTAYDASGFEPINWSPGHAGSGGGGAVGLRANGRFVLSSTGAVLARGGDALIYLADTTNFTNPAPGGAGSGGSVVVQSMAAPDLQGLVDVRGGDAGLYRPSNYSLSVDSSSGAGGPGVIRLESAANFDSTKVTLRPSNPNSAARLNDPSILTSGSAVSTWIDVQRFPSSWHYAVLNVVLGTTNRAFSDNTEFGLAFTQRVSVQFQGATLDAQGRVVGQATPWSDRLSSLNSRAPSLNGVRYRIVLDNTSVPLDSLAATGISLFFDC